MPALAAVAAPGFAQSREATLFGTRERVTGVRLSPDGTRYLALIAEGARGTRVVVGDVGMAQPARTAFTVDGNPQRLTHCNWASASRLVCGLYAFIGKGDHVKAGSPAQNAEAIRTPVLLFHGELDRNVGAGESRTMAARLKKAGKSVDDVEFKGLDHQIDDSDARIGMLDRADAFLRKSMGL